jgi:opacity protein-like surface antigen
MRRVLLVALFAFTLSLLAIPPAVAQVGRTPATSPYHDILGARWLDFSVGRVLGTGGPLLVGPRNGTLGGARVTFRGDHTLSLSLGAWYAGTVRHVVDANDSVATRVKPDVSNSLIAAEFALQMNLTGAKSWHRMAPFAALGIGLAKGQATPKSDTSGYSFGTRFYFAPSAGTRIMLTRSVALRAEARALFWSLKYPSSYSVEPVKQPGTASNPNAVNTTGKSGGYTVTPALLLGLSVRF